METVDQLARELEKYDLAIRDAPQSSNNHCCRGVVLYQLKKYEEAIESYSKALELDPNYYEAYSNKGVALKMLGKLDEALMHYDHAISIKPNYAEAYSNKSVALCKMKRHAEALECCEKAIHFKPDYAGAFYNQGIALQGLNRLGEAEASYKKAIELDPNHAAAYCDIGVVRHELGDLAGALSFYDQALALDSAFSRAYWNKANSMLLLGNFSAGLPLYEWRWKPELTTSTIRNFSQPLWLGAENLAGKTILLHCEQGAGDSIQCIRYAASVRALAAKVIVEAPKSLARLFNGVKGVDEVVETGKKLPEFDVHCPLMSLPLAFDTSIDTIPTQIPYLTADDLLKNRWESKLGEKTKRRVGLVWSGSQTHGHDNKRSLAFSSFAKNLPIDFEYVCLQKEVREEDVAALHQSHVRHFEADIDDFADTAALCSLMDLVITVDTSVAHLAGALGVKTWILLSFVPDWRWMLHRSDTPWYKTATLFRQDAQKNWDSVLNQISNQLTSLQETMGTKNRGSEKFLDMQCFYINLDAQHDRRVVIEDSFSKNKRQGWQLNRFVAYPQSHADVESASGRISATEKGCFLSHQSIVEQNLDSHQPIMILEDDALFGAKTCDFIEKFLEQWSVKNEWDILFADVVITQPEKMLELFKIKKSLRESNQCKVIDLKSYVFAGANSYLLSASGIRKLNEALRSNASLDVPYDLFLRNLIWTGKLKGFMLFPFVTTLSSQAMTSQIQPAETALTDLVWNTFRKMMWIESGLDDLSEAANKIKLELFDKESELLSVVLAATVSPKFISK